MRIALAPLALALLLAARAVGAADAPQPPPQDDLPSPEQIDAVTKTRPLSGVDDAADATVLEPVSVQASRVRETAFRTVQVALDRPRSDKAEDADTLVCQKRQRVGTHITKIYCATNRTWNYIRKQTTGAVLGAQNTVGAPYTLTEGPVYELSPTALNKIGKDFNDGNHAERLAQLVAEDKVGKLRDEWDTPTETVIRFAKALRAVGKAVDDAAMGAAISANGFTVDQYNVLVTRLEQSDLFQRRVAAATQALGR